MQVNRLSQLRLLAISKLSSVQAFFEKEKELFFLQQIFGAMQSYSFEHNFCVICSGVKFVPSVKGSLQHSIALRFGIFLDKRQSFLKYLEFSHSQYIFPGLMRDRFSFQKVRPLHVSSVVFWIILAGLGSMLTYLQQHTKRVIYSYRLLLLQYCIFLLTVVSIIISYFLGRFGGREYWEHPPYLALPIFFGWIFFFKLVGFFCYSIS